MFQPNKISGKIYGQYLLGINHPSKIRIQNLIGKNCFKNGIELQDEHGVKLNLNANDWITRIILMEGNYENASTALAKELLLNGGVCIDIGANFGLFTCIAATGNNKVKVIAIEPNYKILTDLIKNLELNNLQDRVQVRNVAAGQKIEWVTMYQPNEDNVGTTQTKAGGDNLLSILSCSLEYICSSSGIEKIKLIKIDIEGNEFAVFENFSFEKFFVENILIEYNHLSPISFEDLKAFFKEKGFDGYSVSGKLLADDATEIEENNIWFKNVSAS